MKVVKGWKIDCLRVRLNLSLMVCELHGEEGCLRVRLPPPLAPEILFLLRDYGRKKAKGEKKMA